MAVRSLFHAARIPPDFSPGEPALVGVSGGRDSVALLHWLRRGGFSRLIVCHLDHALRPESREDAAFVRELAQGQGCAFEMARIDVSTRAKRKKRSLETAAREARHEFFADCAEKHGTARLFLAHHADDQVETFLFNLLRGAGPGGLRGMAPVSRIGELLAVRPLLAVWREEIDAYVKTHALAWREDASNASSAHTRNRIRHEALPVLSAVMERDVRVALWRAAELLRAENELLSQNSLESQEPWLSAGALRFLPVAIQRRVIHAWLGRQGIPSVGFEEVEAVRSLLELRIAKVNLPGNRHARRRTGRIFCE